MIKLATAVFTSATLNWQTNSQTPKHDKRIRQTAHPRAPTSYRDFDVTVKPRSMASSDDGEVFEDCVETPSDLPRDMASLDDDEVFEDCIETPSNRPLNTTKTKCGSSCQASSPATDHKDGADSGSPQTPRERQIQQKFQAVRRSSRTLPEQDDANNPQARIDYENKRYVACKEKCMDLLRQRNLPPLTRCLTLQLLASCSYYYGAKTALEQALKIASQVCTLSYIHQSDLTSFSWETWIRMGSYERTLRSCWRNLSSIVQSVANPMFTSRSSRRRIVERLGVVCNMVLIIEYEHFGSGG